ncbi:MAG: hypothetical protein SW833_17825 [Cyanobacteriota bacterium]|nr:hypothetical protein [Cyanobacteriota bacterium]
MSNLQNLPPSQSTTESVQTAPVTVDFLPALLQDGDSPVAIILAIAVLLRVLMCRDRVK